MKLEGFKLSEKATPAALISYAAWYIGQMEKSGNSGFKDPAFEKEMIAAGWQGPTKDRPGDPWCATFAKMVFRKGFTGDLLASVNRQFNASAKQTADRVRGAGVFAVGLVPVPGAVVLFLHGHGPSGHAGIVASVDLAKNIMYCIEGNTNASGSREGDSVARKPRTITKPFTADGLNVYLFIYPWLKA
jgi:hypothetical protein